jgi:hypothetical protein
MALTVLGWLKCKHRKGYRCVNKNNRRFCLRKKALRVKYLGRYYGLQGRFAFKLVLDLKYTNLPSSDAF